MKLLIPVLIMLLVLPGVHAANWTVSGDTVFWNASWGKIVVWPHTSPALSQHEQFINITWYLPANTLDFAFVFDIPIKGNVSYYNPATQKWVNVTSQVYRQAYEGRYYYIYPSVAMARNQTRQVRVQYKARFGSSGKWTLMAKLHADDLQTARATGRFLELDPWWNTSNMARWEFNDASGTILSDTSGNGNNGHLIGSPTWGTGAGCLEAGCLNFTGSGQRVTIASSSTLQGLFNFTIIGWAKFNEVGIVQTVLAKNNASSQQTFDISLNSGNGWTFSYWDTSGTLGDILSDPPGGVNITQGICFAMTRDVSLGTNNYKTYFNAVLKDQATKTNNQMQLSPATNMTIGQRGDNGQQVNASIDRVWIFNRTLSTTEMTSICSSALPDDSPPTVNITAPTNTTYTNASIWVNVTLNDDTGNVTAELDGTTNYSLTNTSGNWNRLLTGVSGGAHNIKIYANDSDGNMNASQVVYFTEALFTVNLRVYRGWNLVTLWENQTLLQVTNWTAAPANITVAQCWAPVNQSWVKYNWTNSSGNSSYVCAKGYAVFLLIGRNDTLNFTNIAVDEVQTGGGGNWTTNLSIYVGYNYLGVPGNVSLVNASNLTSSFRFVSCWNASKQEWFTYFNTTVWAGGLHNTSVCQMGTGVMLYSLVNETVLMKREVGVTGAQVAAFVLFLAVAAWLVRWFSRSGQA